MSSYAPPTRILLISHPATREQKAGIFPADEAPDEESLAELASLNWRPPRDARAITSPEARTCESALALGLKASVVSELRDCDFGQWRGLSLEKLQDHDLPGLAQWLEDVSAAPHGGESFLNVIARVGSWIHRQEEVGPLVAVTHASIVRAALVAALQLPPQTFLRIEVAPQSLTELRFTGGQWRLRSMGIPLVR